MTTNPQARNPEQASKSVASVDRRRMLKASALAAPVIATLPNSAALANASSAQCIQADYNATHGTTKATFKTETDHYLQVRAEKGTLTRTKEDGSTVVEEGIKVAGTYYKYKKSNGTWKSVSVPDPWKFAKKTDGYVHAIFEPRGSDLITVSTTDPVGAVKVAGWPAQDLKDEDNMLLSGSCWSSLNPMANGG